ncbi:MAG: hypothetical protein KF708_02565 [Pirellulales bacterium]|nr:hypothetical protein [Pirellulales bacterium]
MPQSLQEYVDSRGVGVRVDRERGIIRGVKILGLESRNGRRYREEALLRAVSLYDGAKVNVNHARAGSAAPREYQDRLGVIRGTVVRAGEGLFGDLHFNPKHALAEQLIWDAEHAPENVGFSHNVLARTNREGNRLIVEAITKVESVDLVADPATTRGLFEAEEAPGEDLAGEPPTDAPRDDELVAWSELTVELLVERRPDLVEEIRATAADDTAEMQRELERLQAVEARTARRELIERLLSEAELPGPNEGEHARTIVSHWFLEALEQAPDERIVREMVADRARLVREVFGPGAPRRRRAGEPQSREQRFFERQRDEALDARQFALAIR